MSIPAHGLSGAAAGVTGRARWIRAGPRRRLATPQGAGTPKLLGVLRLRAARPRRAGRDVGRADGRSPELHGAHEQRPVLPRVDGGAAAGLWPGRALGEHAVHTWVTVFLVTMYLAYVTAVALSGSSVCTG